MKIQVYCHEAYLVLYFSHTMLNGFISIHCRLWRICNVLSARICLSCSPSSKQRPRPQGEDALPARISLFAYEVLFESGVQTPSRMLIPKRRWSLIFYSHPESPSRPPNQPPSAAGDSESKLQASSGKRQHR